MAKKVAKRTMGVQDNGINNYRRNAVSSSIRE